jgi:hypothetical protein
MNLLGDQGMGKVHAAGGTELRRFLGRRDLFTMHRFAGGSASSRAKRRNITNLAGPAGSASDLTFPPHLPC